MDILILQFDCFEKLNIVLWGDKHTGGVYSALGHFVPLRLAQCITLYLFSSNFFYWFYKFWLSFAKYKKPKAGFVKFRDQIKKNQRQQSKFVIFSKLARSRWSKIGPVHICKSCLNRFYRSQVIPLLSYAKSWNGTKQAKIEPWQNSAKFREKKASLCCACVRYR